MYLVYEIKSYAIVFRDHSFIRKRHIVSNSLKTVSLVFNIGWSDPRRKMY